MRSPFIPALLAVLPLSSALAAPGDVDTTFGQAGLFQLFDGGGTSSAQFVDRDANGGLLFAGSASERRTALFGRLTPGGMLDPTFGGVGYLQRPASPVMFPIEFGIALKPTSDGGAIVIENFTGPCLPGPDCSIGEASAGGWIRKLTAAGTFDPGFTAGVTPNTGDGGFPTREVVHVAFGWPAPDGFSIVTRSPGGRIATDLSLTPVLASGIPQPAPYALDCSTFAPTASRGSALAPARNGKLVVAQMFTTASGLSLCMFRFTAQGIKDPAFGQAGVVVRDDLLLREDTALVAAFTKSTGGLALVFNKVYSPPGSAAGSYFVMHFTEEGVLDASRFDRGISGPSDLPVALVTAVAMQPDDKLLIAGYPTLPPTATRVAGFDTANPVIGRTLDAGGIDLTFGSAGTGIVSLRLGFDAFSPSHIRYAPDAIHLAGQVVTTGTANTPRAALVKLQGSSPPVIPPPMNGGGGGCYTNSVNRPDPTLALLALLAAMALGFRRRRRS